MVKLTKEQIMRFKSNIKKTNKCWEWTGGIVKDRGGYGRFHANGKSYRAHRISWQIYRGKWPGELFVCHKCDNTKCVNPGHLFLGTTQDNMNDMKKKGRSPKLSGEKHPSVKLREYQVINIRKTYKKGNITCRELSKRYGVSPSLINLIIKNKRWKYLKE